MTSKTLPYDLPGQVTTLQNPESGLGLRFWLVAIALFAMFLTVSGQPEFARIGGTDLYDGTVTGSNAIRQLAFLGLGVFSTGCLFLLGRAQGKEPLWSLLFPAIAMLGYVNLSTVWSDSPTMTFKRAIVVTILGFTGLVLGRIWDAKRLAMAIVLISLGFLAISIGFEIRYRSFLMSEYRFSGIFHPNKQALSLGLLAVSSFALYFEDRKKIFLLITAIALGFIVLTKSRTGLAGALVGIGVITWMELGWSKRFGIALSILLLGIGGLLATKALAPDVEVENVVLLGRDKETADPRKLTGRLDIWKDVLDEYADRPVLGYGYGAFWSPSRLIKYERSSGWAVPDAHSAYIEALANVGAVGLLLGCGILFSAIARLVRLRNHPSCRLTSRLGLAILVMGMVVGLTEISFVAEGYEAWAVCSIIGCCCFSGAADDEGVESP
ncbi:MAG: O-antigen ligase family protein [Planctomycetes bacterium]|nr:O-antigen ligase family protein [Planctomycetota bacterium]